MFAVRLKELRPGKKISQKALADMLGLAQSSVNQYEHKESEPDITTLKRMADIFDCSVDYIIGHTNCRSNIDKLLRYEITPAELELLDKYREATPHMQKILDQLLGVYLKDVGKEGE